MAIHDNLTDLLANRNGGNTNEKPREKAKEWLNVGVYLPDPDNEGEKLFIGLPMGIPMDQVRPRDMTTNERQNQINQVSNQLQENLRQVLESMEPGEERTVELSAVLRKVKSSDAPAADSNPMLTALNSMPIAKRA